MYSHACARHWRDREGKLSLAGEVLELYEEGAFDLTISRVVVDELEEVIDRDFPEARLEVVEMLTPFTDYLTRRPTPEEIATAGPFCTDPGDAPIFAAAVVAEPDIVLSNDFRAFRTPQAKTFWEKHDITIESLYGLLCVFGRRERQGH